MKLTRREMLLASVGLLVAGCAEQTALMTDRPHTEWPTNVSRPRPVVVAPPAPAVPPAPASTPATPVAAALNALPRSSWAAKPPISARILPMNGVSRITCHHEGWTPVWFNDALTTRDRMETIRASHINRLNAGDIGYHFVVDRAGRLWEGRPLIYQGAHVKNQNENNIGIMMLGNFEKQSPTSAQLMTLERTLTLLRRQYRVPVSRIYTHRELNPTACPGQNLQPRIVSMRTNGSLA